MLWKIQINTAVCLLLPEKFETPIRRYFKIKLTYHCFEPTRVQKLLRQSYNIGINMNLNFKPGIEMENCGIKQAAACHKVMKMISCHSILNFSNCQKAGAKMQELS